MLAPFEISDHPAGGMVSRGTGHPAAGMGPGAAEVKVFYGGAVLGRSGMRAQAEKIWSRPWRPWISRNPQFCNFIYCVKQSERQDC